MSKYPLLLHDEISDDGNAIPLSYTEFIQLVYKEYIVFSHWFDELFRNVLDESASFADSETRFGYLDRMLPGEIPRQWLWRLSIGG